MGATKQTATGPLGPVEGILETIADKINVGITTLIGWGGGLLLLLPMILKVLEEGQQALLIGGPEKWLAIAGIVLAGISSIGRYVQAAILTHARGKAAVVALQIEHMKEQRALVEASQLNLAGGTVGEGPTAP